MQPITPNEIEAIVEHVAEVCDSVEFLHGVPVKLPSETKALLRGRIRKALTQLNANRTAEIREAVNVRTQEVTKLVLEMVPPYTDGHHKDGYNQARKDIIKALSPEVKDDTSPVYKFFTSPEEVQRPAVEGAIKQAGKEQQELLDKDDSK